MLILKEPEIAVNFIDAIRHNTLLAFPVSHSIFTDMIHAILVVT